MKITTHKELLKLHGRKVTCEIEGHIITDAKISVEGDDEVYVCQNEKEGSLADDKLGYDYSWIISNSYHTYEECNQGCTDITVTEEPTL